MVRGVCDSSEVIVWHSNALNSISKLQNHFTLCGQQVICALWAICKLQNQGQI